MRCVACQHKSHRVTFKFRFSSTASQNVSIINALSSLQHLKKYSGNIFSALTNEQQLSLYRAFQNLTALCVGQEFPTPLLNQLLSNNHLQSLQLTSSYHKLQHVSPCTTLTKFILDSSQGNLTATDQCLSELCRIAPNLRQLQCNASILWFHEPFDSAVDANTWWCSLQHLHIEYYDFDSFHGLICSNALSQSKLTHLVLSEILTVNNRDTQLLIDQVITLLHASQTIRILDIIYNAHIASFPQMNAILAKTFTNISISVSSIQNSNFVLK